MAETHSLRTAELEVFFRSDISIRYWKSVPWKEGLLAIAANSAGLDLKWCLLLLKGPEERIFLVLFLHLPFSSHRELWVLSLPTFLFSKLMKV